MRSERSSPSGSKESTSQDVADVAVIGAGWWSQGWHIPQLSRNTRANLVGIVDSASQPRSNLNPHLESLEALARKYDTAVFSSVSDLLANTPTLDGVIVATPHSTHYNIGKEIYDANRNREKPIHILMEKPMTTNIEEAYQLHQLVASRPEVSFLINHSANYRSQTKAAHQAVPQLGSLRYGSIFMASALSWIFEDPSNTGWNVPGPDMLGNGFAWGQSSHVLAWVFYVCPQLSPIEVYCRMTHSTATGADVALSGTIICRDCHSDNEVILSVAGTSLLPGNEHSDPPVGKQIQFKLYGEDGAIIYCGDTRDENTGNLELRRVSMDGVVELPVGPGFAFENLETEHDGPESLQAFLDACVGKSTHVGADSLVGLKTVQVLDAMYHLVRK